MMISHDRGTSKGMIHKAKLGKFPVPVTTYPDEHDQWEFFPDREGEWRWLRTNNDGVMLTSSRRGYRNVLDCIQNAIDCGYETVINILYLGKQGEEERLASAMSRRATGS